MIAPLTDRLTITVSKTADGQHDYVQILSGDQFGLAIVLIAGAVEVRDARPPKKAKA